MLLALLACRSPEPEPVPGTPPPGGNILIVVLDDVGVDKVAAYAPAARELRTPTLDRIAAGGVRFTNAWAYSSCVPTRAALQTGRHARRTGHGVVTGVRLDPNELDPGQTTIAEIAKASPWTPYHTAYIGKWHLSGYLSPSGTLGPVVQGYDRWVGVLGNTTTWADEAPLDAGYYDWERVDETGAVTPTTTYATIRQTDDALAVLADLPEPWLVQVAYSAAHPPWDLPPVALHSDPGLAADDPPPRIEQAMVEALDTELGRLLDGIDDGVLDRTTLIVLGDNGTPEDAIVAPYDPLRGKTTLYDGGVHVPFVVSGPLVGAPGAVSDALVSVVDVLPTVASIVGFDTSGLGAVLDPDQPLGLDGVDLLPLLADPTLPAPRAVLYSERFSPRGPGPFTVDLRTVRDERYKLIFDAITGREYLYAYGAAIDEGRELLADGPDPDQETARTHLRSEMDALVAGLTFDAAPFVDLPTDTGTD